MPARIISMGASFRILVSPTIQAGVRAFRVTFMPFRIRAAPTEAKPSMEGAEAMIM